MKKPRILLIVLLIGCGKSASFEKTEKTLTADEQARQIELLDAALAAHERGEFVGASVSQHQELLGLANITGTTTEGDAKFVRHIFYPSRGTNITALPDRLAAREQDIEGPPSITIDADGAPLCIKSVELNDTDY